MKTTHIRFIPTVLSVLLAAGAAAADDEYQKIIYVRVGDAAPAFECKDDQGAVWMGGAAPVVDGRFLCGNWHLTDCFIAKLTSQWLVVGESDSE